MKYILIIIALVTTQSISATSPTQLTEIEKSISLFRLFKVEVRKSRNVRLTRESRFVRNPIYIKKIKNSKDLRISSIKK